jgi:hypothetical protein
MLHSYARAQSGPSGRRYTGSLLEFTGLGLAEFEAWSKTGEVPERWIRVHWRPVETYDGGRSQIRHHDGRSLSWERAPYPPDVTAGIEGQDSPRGFEWTRRNAAGETEDCGWSESRRMSVVADDFRALWL